MGKTGGKRALVLVAALLPSTSAGEDPAPSPQKGERSESPPAKGGAKARPALPPEAARQLKELDEKIESARRGAFEEDRSSQDEAIKEGIRLAEEAIAIREKHQGRSGGRKTKARAEWHELADARWSLRMFQAVLAMSEPERARFAKVESVRREGRQLFEKGLLQEAQQLLREALEIDRGLFPGDHPRTAARMSDLAMLLEAQRDYEAAAQLFRESLDMYRRLFPGDHPFVAISLKNLSLLLKGQGDLKGAEPLLHEAVEIQRRLLPGDHPDVAESLNDLGLLLKTGGDLPGAERAYEEAVEMVRRLFEGDHPSVATSLTNLAALRQVRGDLEGAERLQREALEMDRRLFPDGSPGVAGSLNNLAEILRARGDLQGAEELSREALEMIRRLFPRDHRHVATSLNNLGVLLMERGNLEEAERFSREALEMRRRLFPGDHMDVAMSLDNLGILLKDRGDLEGAESLCREGLEMFRRIFHGDHPQLATSLSNLAWLLGSRGDLHGAEQLHREALEMFRRLFPGDHQGVALSYHNLGFLLHKKGDLEGAGDLYQKALEMSRRLFQGDHPSAATSLDRLGTLLHSRGDLQGAERLFREALAMRRRLYPGDHPDLVNSLSNVANVLLERGDLAGVETHSREAFEMSRRLFPGDHPQVALSLTILASLLNARGDFEGAASSYDAALSMVERLRPRVVGEEQARARLAGELNISGIALAHAVALTRLGRPSEALGSCERGRGRAFLDLLERGSLDLVALGRARAAEDTEALHRLEAAIEGESKARIDLTTAEARAEALQRERSGAGRLEALEERKRRLAVFEEEENSQLEKVKELRRKLSEAGAAVLIELRGLLPDARPLPAEEIVRVLPPGDLVLSYLASRDGVLLAAASRAKTRAMLVAGGREEVKKMRDLTRAVRDWIAKRPSNAGGGLGEKAARELLHALLPDEAMEVAKGARRLVVLPDGPLTDVPLDLLLSVSGDPQLEMKPVVHAASATVYVNGLRAKEKGEARGLDALLVAHPVYERAPSPEGSSRGDASLKAEVSATDQVRLFGGKLRPLPGTRREALAIAEVVRRAKGSAKLLLGENATVRELSRYAQGKRFLHFATHGLMGSAERPYDASLALTRPREPSPEDIGFLRLEEILRSWRGKLEGCDLVVLSACNTERGVRSGESVFALPLGFFYAGAKTVVASLWEVDDQATALLMVRFYENLLGAFDEPRRVAGREHAPGEAFGIEPALREAKAWLRNLDVEAAKKARARVGELAKASAPAEKKEGTNSRGTRGQASSPSSKLEAGSRPYAHPYFWAAFVCVGKGD